MMFVVNGTSPKNGSLVGRNEQNPWMFSGATVEDFCKELPPVKSRTLVNTVKEIARLRQQMVVNMLAIGDRLGKLRAALGSDRFSHFMRAILPTLGISRSTGYRWMGVAEKLALIFPNPFVRQQLMALTDGRGIVAYPAKDGKRDLSTVVFTPAAQAALETLPPAPNGNEGRLESREWVTQFVKATGRARAQVRIPGRNRPKHQDAIIWSFRRFAAYYGPQAAEDLCGQLDKALNGIVERAANF